MEKKQLFQKQLLESRILENTKTLLSLQNSYDNIKSTSNIDINITINEFASLNISGLQKEKLILENKYKLIKHTINDITLNISKLENDLKQNPEIIKDKYKNEEIIFNEENIRIENEKIEAINTNIIDINNANLDKEKLLKEIEILQMNINLQSNNINNIQIECHTSRKNILETLKNKKQLKNKLNIEIDNANISLNNFAEQIGDLNNTQLLLVNFKKLLVDVEYNTTNDTTNDTIISTLNDYYKLFNIDNTMSLNDKISNIDNIINDNENTIILLNNKKTKTEILNNFMIKETHYNYHNTNNTNKTKVLTYKDNFKIEKEKKIKLETILEDKLNLYNNYNSLVIDKINYKLKEYLDKLDIDKQNAKNRLFIIKVRMNKEFEMNKKILKNKIENNKLEKENLYNEINNISKNIQIINNALEKEIIIDNELIILKNKIEKHKDIIIQSEKDLLSIK
jgi:hypothetical protein